MGPPGPAGGRGDAVHTLWWPGVVGGVRDMQALDSEQVYETPFEDKFVPRRCSNDLLIGVLRAVLVAQQRRDPVVDQEVKKASWDPAAWNIHAGLSEGSAAAWAKKFLADTGPCNFAPSASVRKHVGTAFRACCVGNLGCRNGLLRYAVPGAPCDSTIRALDAFAGLAKTEVYGINQMRFERLIHLAELRAPKKRPWVIGDLEGSR